MLLNNLRIITGKNLSKKIQKLCLEYSEILPNGNSAVISIFFFFLEIQFIYILYIVITSISFIPSFRIYERNESKKQHFSVGKKKY